MIEGHVAGGAGVLVLICKASKFSVGVSVGVTVAEGVGVFVETTSVTGCITGAKGVKLDSIWDVGEDAKVAGCW